MSNKKYAIKPLDLLSIEERDELSNPNVIDPVNEVASDDLVPILDVSSSRNNRTKKIRAGQLVADIAGDTFADKELSNIDDYAQARDNLGLGDLSIKDDIEATDINESDVGNINNRLGTFATIADVQNSHIPAVLESIRTEGFHEPGIGGSLLLRKAQGAPGLPGDVTSADGAQWEVAGTDITILQLGAKADGDGAGGGTAIDDAMQDAVDLMASRGGGLVRLPYSGTGIYRLDGTIVGASNVEIVVDPGVHIDVTHGGRFTWTGSVEAEINLGANATRGDTTISTAAAHGFAVGDWFFLKSQRLAMDMEDAGEDWWLGWPTGGTTGVYFAEPCQVTEVISSTEVRIAKPLTFPDYRTDDSEESSPHARPTSTIQKINWLDRPKFRGGRFINSNPAYGRLDFTWCHAPEVDGVDFLYNTGNQRGHSIRIESCFAPVVRRPFSDRPGLQSDDVIGNDHYQFNSYLEVGCWYSVWDGIRDQRGAQGLDITWANFGHPSIGFYVRDLFSVGNIEQGMTTHSGAWGGIIENPRIYGAGTSAIYNRARNVHIINPQIHSDKRDSATGIANSASGVGTVIHGGLISGCNIGISSNDGELGNKGPRRRKLHIEGVGFLQNNTNVRVVTLSVDRPSTETSEVTLKNLYHLGGWRIGIFIEAYANGITIDNNFFGPCDPDAGTVWGIYASPNTSKHNITRNLCQDMGANAAFLFAGNVTDRTTFSAEDYPNPLHFLQSNEIRGAGNFGSVHQTIPHDRRVGLNGPVALTDDTVPNPMTVENNGNLNLLFLAAALGVVNLRFGSGDDILKGGIAYHLDSGNFRLRTNGVHRWRIDGTGHLYPEADDAYTLGRTNSRPSLIYAASGTINTSDAREKTPLRQMTEAERAVAVRLSHLPGVYQWTSAIEKKGEAEARLHMGVLAQDVQAAFEAEGLDGFRYGVLCYDEWDAEDAEFDEDGNEVSPARPAGDRYGIRYDELAQWQAAGWNARLEDLEGEVNG